MSTTTRARPRRLIVAGAPAAAEPSSLPKTRPTRELFAAYRAMFRHFNRELFAAELPEIVLNFSRKNGSSGFFAPERWERSAVAGVASAESTHEISLNPDRLSQDPPVEVCGTLVHEMAHLWQHVAGSAPSKGYHDRQWADKMEGLGLMPSSTGAPGGARTGTKMADYPIPGGRFLEAFKSLPPEALLPWRARTPAPRAPRAGADERGEGAEGEEGAGEPKPPKDPSKVKFTCPHCGANAWGRVGLALLCGLVDCDAAKMERA